MTCNGAQSFRWGFVVLSMVAVMACACNTSESGNVPVDRCNGDEDCTKGLVCIDYRCVLPQSDGDGDNVDAVENDSEEPDSVDIADGDSPDEDSIDGDDDTDAVDTVEVIDETESDPEPDADPEPEEELPAPAGNTCDNAVPVTMGSEPVTVDSRGAWSSSLEATIDCTGRAQRGPDMFFSINMTAGQPLLVSVRPSQDFKLDLSIAILDSCGQGQQCIAGKDLDGADMEWLHFKAPAAGTYYIVIGTSVNTPENPLDFATNGVFDLLVASAAPQMQCGVCADTYNLGFPYCGVDAGCYTFIYDGHTAETACLHHCQTDEECGNPLYKCRSVPVDGGTSSTYCVPTYEGTNTATCSAILEMGQVCTDNELSGDDDDQCGADDLQVIQDAECVTSGLLPPKSYCSIPCQGEAEICPQGFSCINIPLIGKYCSPE